MAFITLLYLLDIIYHRDTLSIRPSVDTGETL